MKGIEAYRKAFEAPHGDLQWAEVNAQARESLLVGTAHGEIVQTGANAQTAFYVRASAGRAGYAYTQDPQEDATSVIRRATENGLACESERSNVLASQTPAVEAPALPPPPSADALAEAAHALAREAERADSRIVQASAQVCMDTLHTRVVNTQGLDAGMARRVYAAEVDILAESEGEQVNASAAVTADRLDALDLARAARRAAWQASMQLCQQDLKPGLYPVLLDSAVAINILTTAWQLFSAQKMLDGASALSGRLDAVIGSKALTVTDRPSRAGCGYRFPLDDEGCAGQEATLVRQGRLTGLLHTQATAARMGVSPTGNSGRVALLTGAIPTELIVVPKVICIEPGEQTPDALLHAMHSGVWITRSFDVFHSVNVGSGDFAIPCSGAVVENGRVARHVGGLTLNGNLLDLFARIAAAGNDLWIDAFLLKSYCIGAPSLLVEALQVGGRG